MDNDKNLKKHVNEVLFQKAEEIWSLYSSKNPKYIIHLCSNLSLGLEPSERNRFEGYLERYSGFEIKYCLMEDLVSLLVEGNTIEINGKVRVIHRNIFEKSDGDVRALIINVDVRDLLRIIINDENMRNDTEPENYNFLLNNEILEEAFDDNVRIYLKQRSKINRNIKETALSEEAHRFFYYNNGITITCSKFEYPKGRNSPVVEITNLQVVNGGQTIHALYEAFSENQAHFEDMDILCRIYETKNKELSVNIAENTNSQNPVKSRDIRSNDYVQKKLEAELKGFDFYYERKKNQHIEKPREKRIDSEKAGQALMAFFNKMPGEAKNSKSLIFGEKYDDVFTDNICAEHVLLVNSLYKDVERFKLEQKKKMMGDHELFEKQSFILHSSYYLLYVFAEYSHEFRVEQTYSNHKTIIGYYEDSKSLIEQAVKLERERLKGTSEEYSHRTFFKGNRPKKHLGDLIKEYVKKTNQP